MVLSLSSNCLSLRSVHKHHIRQQGTIFHTTALRERPPDIENLICSCLENIGGVRKEGLLRRQQIIVVDWCYLCKKNRETVDHLLLHCKRTSALWNSIFGLYGLAWVMSRRVRDLFACWRGQFGNLRSEAVWKTIPLCLM
jgi:hypothetical protein